MPGRSGFSRGRKRGRHHWQQRAGRHKGKQRVRDRGGLPAHWCRSGQASFFSLCLPPICSMLPPVPFTDDKASCGKTTTASRFFVLPCKNDCPRSPCRTHTVLKRIGTILLGRSLLPDPGLFFRAELSGPAPVFASVPSGACADPSLVRCALLSCSPGLVPSGVLSTGLVPSGLGPGSWVLAELPVRLPLQKPCSRAGARTSPARYQGRARRKARIPRGTGTCPTS